MSINPPSLGALVSNTSSARLPGPEPLLGNHVTLEHLTPTHYISLWTHIGSNHALWTWWPEGPFDTSSSFAAWLSTLHGQYQGLVVYAILPNTGPARGEAIGLAFAFSEARDTHRVAEIGLFFSPLLSGSRAGTEVVYLICKLMFGLNHRRLQWKTNTMNVASKKAAVRYGFVYEGVFRQHMVCKGRNRDSAWFSMLDGEEWGRCGEALERWLDEGNFDGEGRQKKRLEEIREGLV